MCVIVRMEFFFFSLSLSLSLSLSFVSFCLEFSLFHGRFFSNSISLYARKSLHSSLYGTFRYARKVIAIFIHCNTLRSSHVYVCMYMCVYVYVCMYVIIPYSTFRTTSQLTYAGVFPLIMFDRACSGKRGGSR